MSKIREKIIDVAFDEIYTKGYQGVSLNEIIKIANVQKGSLYHHFKSKKELALSVIRERVSIKNQNTWKRLREIDSGFLDFIFLILRETEQRDFKRGCPIGNLLQEMSSIDEEFKFEIDTILKSWQSLFKSIIEKAIEARELREVDSEKLSLFLISNIEGAILLSKNSKSEKEYLICVEELQNYFEYLKVR